MKLSIVILFVLIACVAAQPFQFLSGIKEMFSTKKPKNNPTEYCKTFGLQQDSPRKQSFDKFIENRSISLLKAKTSFFSLIQQNVCFR